MTDRILTLFCLVDGEATCNAFSVEIDRSKTVDGLKKLIKAEKTNSFHDVDANELTLWKVSVPIPRHDDIIPILVSNVKGDRENLSPAIHLSKVFSQELPEETVHVIVQRPPPALRTIKKFQNNDMITFFGVSGCGKTRAVVEMLAQNWGFYLNGSQADRGCLLISRLMVLKYCLSLGRHDTFTCDQWMLLQVCPGAFDESVSDIFDNVFRIVLNAYHDQTPAIPLLSLELLLQDRFRLVQDLISSFASDSLTKKLLVVLDEAQTLSDHGREFFISSADPRDMRSILSPIIHGLRNISKSRQDYCVVTCGTGIGADELEILVGSGGIAATLDQIDH
ncbi:hypothetical protein BG006_003312 [Podila minutissima]|uniref:Crinkler effector protein N-terminal domain-containing protein n=1 Tax=Podila minutissima TaxID=64525 RepID=A0A9P5VGE4_9FUNG|nr:hypothetical protein BG006_003312 [Podila minutissima]